MSGRLLLLLWLNHVQLATWNVFNMFSLSRERRIFKNICETPDFVRRKTDESKFAFTNSSKCRISVKIEREKKNGRFSLFGQGENEEWKKCRLRILLSKPQSFKFRTVSHRYQKDFFFFCCYCRSTSWSNVNICGNQHLFMSSF